MQYRKRAAIYNYDLELQNSYQNLYNLLHGFPIYVVLKSIYMIDANIKISLYHEIAIMVLDQGRGKLLNIENHRMSH